MKHSVMVVDDSRVVYAGMQKMLSDSEFEICSFCRSGEECLEKYGDVQPELVTMDIVMPEMDGMEACRQLLERWPDARVLMVSSLAYDDTIKSSQTLGAKGFLFKPFDKEALLRELRSVVAAQAD